MSGTKTDIYDVDIFATARMHLRGKLLVPVFTTAEQWAESSEHTDVEL
jgi:hypothetical protein